MKVRLGIIMHLRRSLSAIEIGVRCTVVKENDINISALLDHSWTRQQIKSHSIVINDLRNVSECFHRYRARRHQQKWFDGPTHDGRWPWVDSFTSRISIYFRTTNTNEQLHAVYRRVPGNSSKNVATKYCTIRISTIIYHQRFLLLQDVGTVFLDLK